MTVSDGPIIFISYSHKDDPDPNLAPQSFSWLTYIKSHLGPAAAHGILELWDDRRIEGGGDWRAEINDALDRCAACVLLVSRHSLSSGFILDVEMRRMLERHHSRGAHLYPIVITSCDIGAAQWLMELNLKPRDGTALEIYPEAQRNKVMADLAREIRIILAKTQTSTLIGSFAPITVPEQVDIDHLPLTPYRNLVGRANELKRLDEAWSNDRINIVSLIAWGGTGKTALVNEWLKRLQADNYRGAEAVLGWSFYSQGSKERVTSAEGFLNWALHKLHLTVDAPSATLKGEKLAEAVAKRRILIVLDGVEPLQHGPGEQESLLKDQGMRAFLRRFATTPPARSHGMILVTSRLRIRDVEQYRQTTDRLGAAQVLDLTELSGEAGAALLADNGVKGVEAELRAAVSEFEGHALALSLLASLLTRRHEGDVRRRDCVGPLLRKSGARGHDHARRVLQAYEIEWLRNEPVLLAILHIIGLFDRPATADCIAAVCSKPVISGLTDYLMNQAKSEWDDAVYALREVRLLAPADIQTEVLDAHPLVREWFGERLQDTNEAAWRTAHIRLYDHLRSIRRGGLAPTFEQLAPLYQSITHGCSAGRHQEALDRVYIDLICRRRPSGKGLAHYSGQKLGAFNSNLAAISSFFKRPFVEPFSSLKTSSQSWVLADAAFSLRSQGRVTEALVAQRIAVQMTVDAGQWPTAAARACLASEMELLLGDIGSALATIAKSIEYASYYHDALQGFRYNCYHANVLHALGKLEDAALYFAEFRTWNKDRRKVVPFGLLGYYFCDLLLSFNKCDDAVTHIQQVMSAHRMSAVALLTVAVDVLVLGRANLGLALAKDQDRSAVQVYASVASLRLEESVERLRATGSLEFVPRGLLARCSFRRSVGDWDIALGDLSEVLEIAEPGPMRLYLSDMALERARLALAKIEAFAPLNGMLEKDNPPKPVVPSADEIAKLKDEAAKQISIADDYIQTCGYHRRDEELAELQAVLRGEKKFAELPPRV